ncbi:unnamed protein product [Nyctereutes procyonoides]|uniref:(raccoon dog) hypothetical protein n=1 Tax=Nyctereutes procyonoides TaxID=34880 RepID=A0A811Z6N4_NYCPR|nr:unnamed protein product [Nyctereutes procyonoides]
MAEEAGSCPHLLAPYSLCSLWWQGCHLLLYLPWFTCI